MLIGEEYSKKLGRDGYMEGLNLKGHLFIIDNEKKIEKENGEETLSELARESAFRSFATIEELTHYIDEMFQV